MFRVLTTAALFAAACWMTTSAHAQSPVLAELYGRGVHNYYAGDYVEAHRLLSLAAEHGSNDPRVFYFRGVVNQLTGRPDEAEADWRRGAELEAQGEYGRAVGRALQRIQGPMRMELEEVRSIVRLEQEANQQARNRARYQQMQEAESRVLRDGARRAPAPPPVPPVGGDANPFERDTPLREGEAQPSDAEVDPFADDEPDAAPDAEQPAAPPADDAEPAMPADEEPEAADPFAPSDEAADDPFAPTGDDEADPFSF